MSSSRTPRGLFLLSLLLPVAPCAFGHCMKGMESECTPDELAALQAADKPQPRISALAAPAVNPPGDRRDGGLPSPSQPFVDEDGDKAASLGLTPDQLAKVDREFPGSTEKMHEKFHKLSDAIDAGVAEGSIPAEEGTRDKTQIDGGLKEIARSANHYVEVKSVWDFLHPGKRKSEAQQLKNTIDRVTNGFGAINIPYRDDDGDPPGHRENVHVAFMEDSGGLAPIMSAIDKFAKEAIDPGGDGGGGHRRKSHKEDTADASPDSARAQTMAAEELLQNNDAQGAKGYLDKALKLDSQNQRALSDMAVADYQLRDNAAAAQNAHAALALKPNDPAAEAVLKFTEGHAGVGGAALNATDLFARRQNAGDGGVAGAFGAGAGALGSAGSGQSAALTRDAISALTAGDSSRAIRSLDKALELNPNNVQALNLRAMALARQRRYADALRDAEAGLKLAPKNQALMDTRALALNKLKRFREAEAQARAAIAQNPNDPNAWRNLSEALAGLGDHEGAMAALRRAAELDPKFKPLLETALQMPADADLNLLFADDTAGAPGAPASVASAAQRKRKTFGLIVGGALALGLLLVLLMWPAVSKGVQTAWATITRKRVVGVAAKQVKETLIKGQYRPGVQIGSGGMGTVYEGLDVALDRKVAIKKMRDEIRSDPHERARFLQEAKTVAALHHANIVDIYAVAEEGQDVYLVFQYVSGKTLHELIAARGRLTLEETMPIIREAAAGLEFAHSRGIIHRDLKPSNIMRNAEGVVKVMDFGIARVAKDALTKVSQVMTNTIVGTPPYMAPEQEQGLVRKESDVYSLALCVYEMLTGRMAFAGTGAGMLMSKINKAYAPVTTLAPELPPEIDAVFAAALDPEPSKRISSPTEFVARLEAVAAGRRKA